jgi:cytoskeletal protein CcmA (bactofilin family)
VGNSVLGTKVRFTASALSSDEDLTIEGIVEGSIANRSHQVTIGRRGRVKADVHARIIVVEGSIEGDLLGEEAVHMRRTARVVGNVTSPRITLEDGATVKGNIRTSARSPAAPPAATEQAPPPLPAGSLRAQ